MPSISFLFILYFIRRLFTQRLSNILFIIRISGIPFHVSTLYRSTLLERTPDPFWKRNRKKQRIIEMVHIQ